MTNHRPRLLATASLTLAAGLLLAGCAAGPTTSEPDPQPSTTQSSGNSGSGSVADLDFPVFYDPSMLAQWADARAALTDGIDAFAADCTAQDSNESDDCHAALFDLLRQVNGLKQLWLAFDNSEWDGGEYSGLEALKPTRDATLVASTSGSDWSGSCAAPGGNEDCVALAEVFLGDLDAVGAAFSAWQG